MNAAPNTSGPATPDVVGADDLAAIVGGDDQAWRAFVERHDARLREVVRHAAEAISELSDADVDDIMGDFWLQLVADRFRLLRAFNPARGSSLAVWLTFQIAHVAHEYLHRRGREPTTVHLQAAAKVADPADPPRSRLRAEETRAAAESELLSDLANFLVKLTLDGKLDPAADDSDSDGKGLLG